VVGCKARLWCAVRADLRKLLGPWAGEVELGQSVDATITQTGVVPLGTKSLQFKAHFDPFSSGGSFSVTLGGQTLSLIPLQAGANYTLYGADISGWAGQTAALNFTVFSYPQQNAADYLFLDAIQFSNQRVPEPGVLSLSASGALLFGTRILVRWRRRRSRSSQRGRP
jgi:hypothetical protein